jgi:hypothetical protein
MQTIKRHPVILILSSILAISSFSMKWSSITSSSPDDFGKITLYFGYQMMPPNFYYGPTIFYGFLVLLGLVLMIRKKSPRMLLGFIFLLHLVLMGAFAFVVGIDYYWSSYWDKLYAGYYIYFVASVTTCTWLYKVSFTNPPRLIDANLLDDL